MWWSSRALASPNRRGRSKLARVGQLWQDASQFKSSNEPHLAWPDLRLLQQCFFRPLIRPSLSPSREKARKCNHPLLNRSIATSLASFTRRLPKPKSLQEQTTNQNPGLPALAIATHAVAEPHPHIPRSSPARRQVPFGCLAVWLSQPKIRCVSRVLCKDRVKLGRLLTFVVLPFELCDTTSKM